MPASVAVRVIGSGPAVMLVHGEVGPGPTWKAQEALSSRWRLVMVTRRGFRPSPAADRQDFAADARDIEKLLGREPAHCVGHGYGAVGLAVAAGRAPDRFRSLTLIEPPPLRPPPASPPAEAEDSAHMRPAHEAEPDLPAVAAAGVPALVLSGAHHPGLEEACDALAAGLGAERERLPGADHAVQRTPAFNRRLERFLFAAESGRR
jgi:pimeloyl-ACP methyl ester carboxylesterase